MTSELGFPVLTPLVRRIGAGISAATFTALLCVFAANKKREDESSRFTCNRAGTCSRLHEPHQLIEALFPTLVVAFLHLFVGELRMRQHHFRPAGHVAELDFD